MVYAIIQNGIYLSGLGQWQCSIVLLRYPLLMWSTSHYNDLKLLECAHYRKSAREGTTVTSRILSCWRVLILKHLDVSCCSMVISLRA